VFFLPT